METRKERELTLKYEEREREATLKVKELVKSNKDVELNKPPAFRLKLKIERDNVNIERFLSQDQE